MLRIVRHGFSGLATQVTPSTNGTNRTNRAGGYHPVRGTSGVGHSMYRQIGQIGNSNQQSACYHEYRLGL
jgi:hypothetical protein